MNGILLGGLTDLCVTNKVSVEVWVKILQTNGMPMNPILTKGWCYGDAAYGIWLCGSGILCAFVESVGSPIRLKCVVPFETDKWYHIVGTYDGRSARSYVQGPLVEAVWGIGDTLVKDVSKYPSVEKSPTTWEGAM